MLLTPVVSGDYKLVQLFGLQGDDMVCTGCQLLSLKTREWRYISHVPIPCFDWQASASIQQQPRSQHLIFTHTDSAQSITLISVLENPPIESNSSALGTNYGSKSKHLTVWRCGAWIEEELWKVLYGDVYADCNLQGRNGVD